MLSRILFALTVSFFAMNIAHADSKVEQQQKVMDEAGKKKGSMNKQVKSKNRSKGGVNSDKATHEIGEKVTL